MNNFESKNILPEDTENTVGKKNVGNEYNFTTFNKQKTEEEREKIKRLNEESKKLIDMSKKMIDASEEKKKESNDLSA